MIFRYTILYVDNVEQALSFYHRAFDFEIGFLHESKDYGELVTGQTKLAFTSRQTDAGTWQDTRPARPRASDIGGRFRDR